MSSPTTSKPVIGIDLGTTFVKCSTYQSDRPVRLDLQNSSQLASIVAFDEDYWNESDPGSSYSQRLVKIGQDAMNKLGHSGWHVFYDSKRFIGRTMYDKETQEIMQMNLPFPIVSDTNNRAVFRCVFTKPQSAKEGKFKNILPQQVSAELLKVVAESLRSQFPSLADGNPIEAVITVPANFPDSQKNATIEAAQMAGFSVIKLIPEPSAAAYAHFMNQKVKPQNGKYILFDFGGGTLDISILDVKDQIYSVLAVAGDTFLGGRNIDELMFNHFGKILRDQYSIETDSQYVTKKKKIERRIRRLRQEIPKLKSALSGRDVTQLVVQDIIEDEEDEAIEGNPCIEFSRQELWDLIHLPTHQDPKGKRNKISLADRMIGCIRDALSSLDIQIDQLTNSTDQMGFKGIILVGGSSLLVSVREIISKALPRLPILNKGDENVTELVAHGAAIVAEQQRRANLEGAELKFFEGSRSGRSASYVGPLSTNAIAPMPVIQDIIPHSLGIALFNNEVSVLIPKFSKYPFAKKEYYTTAADYQTDVPIQVLEGESKKADENRLLDSFMLSGLPPMKKGEAELEVKFAIDISGILRVSGVPLSVSGTALMNNMKSIEVRSATRRTAAELKDIANSPGKEVLMYPEGIRMAIKRLTTKAYALKFEILNVQDVTARKRFMNEWADVNSFIHAFHGQSLSLRDIESKEKCLDNLKQQVQKNSSKGADIAKAIMMCKQSE